VIFTVFCYWIVSISAVYLNKVLITDSEHFFPAPLFVASYQCFVTCLMCKLTGFLGSFLSSSSSFFLGKKAPRLSYDPDLAFRVLPVSLFFVGMIGTNNMCLQYVPVAFFNVARSLTLLFSALLSFFVCREKLSWDTGACLGIICSGFCLGHLGQTQWNIKGGLLGIVSSLFVACHSIWVKKGLDIVEDDTWALTYHNNVNGALVLGLLSYLIESNTLLGHLYILASPKYWLIASLDGILCYFVGIVTYIQIQVTSPLTHTVSSSSRAALQSILAFVIWKGSPNLKGILGTSLVLLGSALYSTFKGKDIAAAGMVLAT